MDHIVPTNETAEPYSDPLAQEMIVTLRDNCKQFGIRFFDTNTGAQGIVHIVAPSRASPSRALPLLAATATPRPTGPSRNRLRHRHKSGARHSRHADNGNGQAQDPRISVNGKLKPGVYAKDVILTSSASSV